MPKIAPYAARALGLLLVVAGIAALPRTHAPERVILIVVDMLRADHLSCYGGTTKTPRLDRLAAEGTRAPHTVAAFHQTTLSMASIFTGQTPSRETTNFAQPLGWTSKVWCGMTRFATAADDRCIPQHLDSLAETMQRKGYWTIGIASNPLMFDPCGYSQGFDDWREVGEPATTLGSESRLAIKRNREAVNQAAIRAVNARPRKRFFLYVHYMDVHDHGVEGLSYARSVSLVDSAIGRLLDRLHDHGLLTNAVVVVTADHGERLGEQHALPGKPTHQGNPSFETLLRVPLIIWPKVRLDLPAVVRGQDTRFLIEEIIGVRSPRPTELDPDEVFLTEDEFLTYRKHPAKVMWRRKDNRLFLFNLETDPGEAHDLAATQTDAVSQYRQRMSQLAHTLTSTREADSALTESDKERLRALGYLN